MSNSRVECQGREYMNEGGERRGGEDKKEGRENLGVVDTRQGKPRRRKPTLSGNTLKTGLSW